MRFFASRFFLLGVFLLLLLSIPLTIFFIKQQQEVRTKAAPSSTLSFSPASKSATVGSNFDLDIMVDPGQNVVSFTKLHLLFDSTKLEAVRISPNIQAFPLTLDAPVISPGTLTVSFGIGSDPARAIQARTKMATVTFKPLAAAGGEGTKISFDPTQTQVLSLSANDQPGENVLQSTSPASVIISEGTAVSIPTPTTTVGGTPTPTSRVTPTGSISPTQAAGQGIPTPTGGVGGGNASPLCSSLTASPLTGSAPLLVNFTAKGNDQDGTITKATFNFGDGKQQDVTATSNQKSVELKASHSYQTTGTYSATVTFTDNNNGVSLACSQSITVTTAGGGTTSTVATPGATTPGATTAVPTLAAPGNLTISMGLLAAIGIITTVGVFLLIL